MPKLLKVWNLGNTTVRNPNRIEKGLQVFAQEFQGDLVGPEAEKRFARRLVEEGIVDSEGTYSDLLGRKWRSVLVKLGFSTNRQYWIGNQRYTVGNLATDRPDLKLKGQGYEMTPVGRRLLEADTLSAKQDIFLRQLLWHEIPSPIEPGFPGGHMKPFVFLLQVLQRLHRSGDAGLTKVEIGVFLQPFVDHTEESLNSGLEKLLGYRKNREQRNTDKIVFDSALLDNTARKMDVSHNTLTDYADTTFRYSMLTGLLTISSSRLILREDALAIIESILTKEPHFTAKQDPLTYLATFYAGAGLPTDDMIFALQEAGRLITSIGDYGKIPTIGKEWISAITNGQDRQKARYSLAEQLRDIKEEVFSKNQCNETAVNEILGYLDALESKRPTDLVIADRPTYLEWTVWRAFLAIDHIVVTPIGRTRRFPVDDNLLPRHPAPGGGEDMLFEFDDYLLAVEVTLTTKLRQLVAEGEPVRRHVVETKGTTNKEVYCVFIAPSIDNNTAETFRIGVWYREDSEDYVNIIPLTIGQFRRVVEVLLHHRFTPQNFQQLLDKCLSYRNVRAPQWKKMIATEVERWARRVTTP